MVVLRRTPRKNVGRVLSNEQEIRAILDEVRSTLRNMKLLKLIPLRSEVL